MTTPSYSFSLKEDRRLQAVMARFRGEPISQVAVKSRMARRVISTNSERVRWLRSRLCLWISLEAPGIRTIV
jgi:hypothetical protein